jgi:hypothetical protein
MPVEVTIRRENRCAALPERPVLKRRGETAVELTWLTKSFTEESRFEFASPADLATREVRTGHHQAPGNDASGG